MFVGTHTGARTILASFAKDPVGAKSSRRRGIGAAAGLAITASLFAASGAFAETCVSTFAVPGPNLAGPAFSASATSAVIGSTVAAANTAFLLQSTAFIGSPPNPAPGQQGGGVWVRGVDGNVQIKSNSSNTFVGTGGLTSAGTAFCSQQVNVVFGGIQFGSDIAKLNWDGWNFHSGVTAGDLGAKANLGGNFPTFVDPSFPGAGNVGGGTFVSASHVPFIGMYAAATNGGFSVDALLRTAFYQNKIDAPISNIFNQGIDARGISFSASATYQMQVPDTNWFVEPSAGLIISRIQVDPLNFNTAGFGTADSLVGTLQVNDITSEIGRVGLRVGETIESGNVLWQPFGAVSVWHEFGKNITSNYTTAPGTAAVPTVAGFGFGGLGTPGAITGTTSTTTFGTYGQYSLGLSAAVAGTGWLEFIRGDYRSGPNLQGWSGSGGVRYQFTPGPAPVLVGKAKAAPVMQAVNWTGFYLGAFGGATQGTADWGTSVGSVSPHIAGYLFGLDGGYNWQFDSYVVGAEVDWAKTNTFGAMACNANSGTGAFTVGATPSQMFDMTCNAWANWLVTATAKLGYAWDRALFYAKLGGAWTNEKASATCNFGVFNATIAGGVGNSGFHCTNAAGANSNGFIASQQRFGWALGWGTEYALTEHWSAKGEADYISFADRNTTATDGTVVKLGMHLWEEKIGVNYRF
jgi:opacity protein-like surface antigen